MPVSREQVRAQLAILIQHQALRPGEHGALLLAVWRDVEEAAQDVHLVEVFEDFSGPDGAGRAVLRFPGMGDLWLPGLYIVDAFSRDEFARLLDSGDPRIGDLRDQLAGGRAEILWPVGHDPASDELVNRINPPQLP